MTAGLKTNAMPPIRTLLGLGRLWWRLSLISRQLNAAPGSVRGWINSRLQIQTESLPKLLYSARNLAKMLMERGFSKAANYPAGQARVWQPSERMWRQNA